MAAIEALVLVVAAGFMFILLAVLVIAVAIGIHQEERRWQLTGQHASAGCAQLARRVLGTYCSIDGPLPDLQISSEDSSEADELVVLR